MKYKALVSFSGKISMGKGEVKAITDKKVIADLLAAGYIEKVTDDKQENDKQENDKQEK